VRNERRVMTTTRGAGRDVHGRSLQKLVSHSTVNRTLQTFRAALYYVRDKHEAFLKPNLKFDITKAEATMREASEAEEAACRRCAAGGLPRHLCVRVALRHPRDRPVHAGTKQGRPPQRRGDVSERAPTRRPAGLRPLGNPGVGALEVALLAEIMAARHHPKYVFTYVAQGKKGGKRGTGNDGVFEKGKRYPITLEALTTRWQRDRAKAAKVLPLVATIRWHDLRHTFASRLLRKTRNPAWVQKAMGHADIKTTMRHYAHVLNDDVRAAKAEMQGDQAASTNFAKVARKVARSLESEIGWLGYVFDFTWLPGPDSNQRPTG
jgi:Phage integrase family